MYPKLHDLLKLAGSSSKHMCPYNYASGLQKIVKSELWTALQHHCLTGFENLNHNCNPYPAGKELLCIHYADKLASTISRRLTAIQYKSRTVFKIWKDTKTPGSKSDQEVPIDEAFLSQINNLDEEATASFFKKNEKLFRERPESIGACPYASLYTHSLLTERWYDFLMDNCAYFAIPVTIQDKKEALSVLYQIASTKSIYLGYAKIQSDTLLVRLKDTQLLRCMQYTLRSAIQTAGGTIIYDLSDEMIFVIAGDQSKEVEKDIQDKLSEKLTSNFYLELTLVSTKLPYSEKSDPVTDKPFLADITRLFEKTDKRIYPVLKERIEPNPSNEASRKSIICDLCQMAPASISFPRENTTEYLCSSCNSLRRASPSYPEIAQWESDREKNRFICLVQISLNNQQIISILSQCFSSQFKDELKIAQQDAKIRDKILKQDDMGFSILFEFLESYKEFIEKFKESVFTHRSFRSKDGQTDSQVNVLNNLFILKLYRLADVMEIFRAASAIFEKEFPKILELKQSPIRIFLSCANIKSPFFEHWRLLKQFQQNEMGHHTLMVNVEGKGMIKSELYNAKGAIALYDALVHQGNRERNMRALHTISTLAQTSEAMANRIIHYDREDRYKGVYGMMCPTRPHGLDARSLLTLAKILGD